MTNPLSSLLRCAFAAPLLALSVLCTTSWASSTVAPDILVRELSTSTMDAVRHDKTIQSGDTQKVRALVESQLLPHVNFKRLTASAMGRHWRDATPEQQVRLQVEFRTLLLRTYAGALSQVTDQRLAMRPLRADPEATEVIVQTQIVGRGAPIQLDYRLAKEGSTWQIHDMNVLGIWLGDQYRNSFSQQISNSGIEGLISTLAAKNRTPPAR